MKNKILYKNFLEDKRIYTLAKNWWKKQFIQQVLGKKPNEENHSFLDWTFNWHNDSFKDGNPIFTVFSASHKKLVRIIQEAESADTTEISAWLEKGFYPKDETPELVISLELSRKSSKIAFDWIKKWLENQLEDKDLEIDFDERNSISI